MDTQHLSHFNASDAPAMMGCSPYKTRAELLREMHTGVAADVDIATQKRFDNGHRAEALARPLAEEFIGAELYPVTGSLGKLSASFDGLMLDESTAFEHKALNDALRAAFDVIETQDGFHGSSPNSVLPLMYRVQMEQQLLVSGAERVLFMSSTWTPDDELIEERHCWYYPDHMLRAQIVAGWYQFAADLTTYTLPPAVEAAPVGKAPETLPALRIEVTGQVTASNLAEFKATALDAIRSVNRTLTTDQDFADADKSIKWCADVESRLAAAKEHALSQTASIDALFRTIDDIAAEARRVRLDLDKLVTRRKGEVRDHAVMAARSALDAHIATLNAELAPFAIRPPLADFAGAIKGRRTMASMQDALDGVLAVSKIASDEEARALRANLATFKDKAAGFEFLFADLGQFLHKAADDFGALLTARIETHKAAELVRENQRREAQRLRAEAAERAASQAVAVAAAPVEAPVAAQQLGTAAADTYTMTGPAPIIRASVAARSDEPATLTLGMICERLQFTVRADFLADVLHVTPAKVEVKRPGTYTESQFATICRQLQSHVSAMAELYCGETA